METIKDGSYRELQSVVVIEFPGSQYPDLRCFRVKPFNDRWHSDSNGESQQLC
jgi:hypothetical protein